MNQEAWLKYVPSVALAVGLVGFVLLGVQNAVLAGQVDQLSAEVTALHEFVAKEKAAGPPPGATAMRRPSRPPGAPPGPGMMGRRPPGPPGAPGMRPGSPPGGGARPGRARPGQPPPPAPE